LCLQEAEDVCSGAVLPKLKRAGVAVVKILDRGVGKDLEERTYLAV
jgi:hypothetical protein